MLVVVPVSEGNGELRVVVVHFFRWVDDHRRSKTIGVLALEHGER